MHQHIRLLYTIGQFTLLKHSSYDPIYQNNKRKPALVSRGDFSIRYTVKPIKFLDQCQKSQKSPGCLARSLKTHVHAQHDVVTVVYFIITSAAVTFFKDCPTIAHGFLSP